MQDFLKTTSLMLSNQILPVVAIEEPLQMAFREVPRHEFVTPAYKNAAYIDGVLPCSKNRTLMPPALLAKCLHYLQVDSMSNVLHIGCANGYASTLMATIAKMVTGIDKDGELLAHASKMCKTLGLSNIRFYQGNVNDGYEENQPYKRIFIETPVTEVSDKILSQLAPGGRCIALVANKLKFVEVMLYLRSDSNLASQTVFEFEHSLLTHP